MLYELIELIRGPFEASKRQAEDSTIGQSDLDRSSIRFWKWFAWIASGIVIGIPLVGWIAWKVLTN
ncbi:hypothetical protein [Haloferula sp.]|uniref:hypothetical protein n=1 Tax=Haloferula sp. TaxID=2497595 RepID=UPI00329EBD92